MNNSDYRGFQAEQTLLNCGFSPESIQSITSTRVVTHDGTQRVIRNDQTHLFENQKSETPNSSLSSNNSQLSEELYQQHQQFSRFKQFADNRIMKLENQMCAVLEQLKLATEVINTMKSNMNASANRERIAQGSNKEAVTEAIDRNGVAPADVCIEKMFYFGNK